MTNNISTASALKWGLLGIAATVSGGMPKQPNPFGGSQDPVQSGASEKFSYPYLPPKEQQLVDALRPSWFEKMVGTVEDPDTYLNFQEDGKQKILYLVGESDHNGALHPSNVKKVLKGIHDKFDLKYQGVRSKEDVCDAVKEASKTGVLQNVVIIAHGNEDGMCLSNCAKIEGWMHISDDYEDCFKELDLRGRISLFGGHAGKLNEEGKNFAQKIANDAKREVMAATGVLYPDKISISDTPALEFHHTIPVSGWSSPPKQPFKLFVPQYKECSPMQPIMNPKEKRAVKAVRDETLSDSQLDRPQMFEEYVTQLCKDNPKKKFLFLAMEDDHNGGVEPKLMKHILEPIAKHYDLKYQVVSSHDELCKSIKEASSVGEVVNLVILGHGFPLGVFIDGDSKKAENYMHKGQDLSCFDHLPDSTTITFLSCCVGAPEEDEDPNNNFAYTIAKTTGKKVIAPDQHCHTDRMRIESIEPFEIFEGSLIPKNESKKNMFHTFNPERTDTKKEKTYKESECYDYKKQN